MIPPFWLILAAMFTPLGLVLWMLAFKTSPPLDDPDDPEENDDWEEE